MKKLQQCAAAILLIALSLNSVPAVFAAQDSAALQTEHTLGSAAAKENTHAVQEQGTHTNAPAEKTSTQSAVIQATVPTAGAAYLVEIPQTVHLGTLDPTQDFQQDYTVGVEVLQPENKIAVTVSAPDSFPMYSSKKERSKTQITCYNTFETATFKENGTADGQLRIPKNEMAAAAPGQYSGTLEFTIQSRRQEERPEETPVPPVIPQPTPSAEPKPTTPPRPTPTPGAAIKPTAAPQPNIPEIDSGAISQDGQYTASVSMRKETDFSQKSMCDALIYPKADIVRKGDMATVSLYVIDPIPKFEAEGTPLRDMAMHYNGNSYPVQIDSTSKVMKQFASAPGFIDTAGEYSASVLTVTLPVQALTDSVNQKLTSTAYVNAVMKQNVEFYVVFSELSATAGKPQNTLAVTSPSSAANKENKTKAKTLTMDQGEKTWYTSSVSMRRADDFNKESMCDPLFYEKAEILYQGDTAELTLYVIDPVPKFVEEGTPMKDVTFLYQEKSYTAKVLSGEKQDKHFEAADGFISEAGEYPATPIKVVLPKAAIEDAKDGKLKCSAYINTVMKTTQQFYVVLSKLEKGVPAQEQQTDKTDPKDGSKNQDELAQQAAAKLPDAIRLNTPLFPQVLFYLLGTAAILGGIFAVQWFRRR